MRKTDSFGELAALFAERVAVLDGATGSLLQRHNLSEADFRGGRFAAHPRDLRGNNDVLNLTRPEIVEGVHAAYFEAGADMVETNTFNSTSVSQADYGLEGIVAELNTAGAACALRAARAAERRDGRRRFVAGSIGPLNRTLSLSPDVNRPEFRAVTWEQVAGAYAEQMRALVTAGVDALLIETVFDTLNAKAALFASETVFGELGRRVPVMVSATIADASGRLLSGQTLEAFYNSVRPAEPFSVGLNCSLGGAAMRPFVEELSRLAECFVTCHPNAGLPNALGAYEETPEQMAAVLGGFAREGWLNMAGGCCGSTPAHIRAIAEAVRGAAPRRAPGRRRGLLLSGLEPLNVTDA
ncbi:MAG: homocysteine S-methyltransferase family protein [Opitutaceae bacterium]|nr:homocysteine S-methyltransferase family protein [Opitutaceae bacterium]